MNLIFVLFLMPFIFANDETVWQGQYYTGSTFHTGVYEFNFTIYNARVDGSICWSNTTFLSKGNFGEWKTEQSGIGFACNNASQTYFLELKINNSTQGERRRLTMWDYLRKDTADRIRGPVTFEGNLYGADGVLHIGTENIYHIVNKSGSARQRFLNQDSSSNTSIISILENDAGYQFSFALTSSTYNQTQQSIGNNRSNLGLISLNASNSLEFLNMWAHPFIWLVSQNGTLFPQITLMRLEGNGNLSLLGNVSIGKNLFVQDIDTQGTMSITENITLGGQVVTNDGCLIPHAVFWAEEAGTISSGGGSLGLEYSFGDSVTESEGIRQPCSGRVVYVTLHAKNAANGNGQVAIVINAATNSSCSLQTPESDATSTQTTCQLAFSQGDHLVPRTVKSPSGQNSGYIVSWWVVYD